MKKLTSFDDFINESEQSSLEDYKKLLNSHDWYFQMSDDDRWYRTGLREVDDIRKVYAYLSPEDKEKALAFYRELYAKYYPKSDYDVDPEKFRGA